MAYTSYVEPNALQAMLSLIINVLFNFSLVQIVIVKDQLIKIAIAYLIFFVIKPKSKSVKHLVWLHLNEARIFCQEKNSDRR